VLAAALDRAAALDAVYLGPHAASAFAPLVARVGAAAIPIYDLKEGVLERIGSTRTPQPVLAVASMPHAHRDVLSGDGLVLVGVELRDPGNVGTMIRSAEAAGAAAILLGPTSVDAYNPKAVRASAGAIFGIPVVHALSEGWSAVDALDALGELGRQRLGADPAAGVPYHEADLRRPTAVVFGNEAHGFGADVAALLDGRITVPMAAPAESLNVGMAATIIAFEAARQRA
jgi:TrmH family RNA methyltransferase